MFNYLVCTRILIRFTGRMDAVSASDENGRRKLRDLVTISFPSKLVAFPGLTGRRGGELNPTQMGN